MSETICAICHDPLETNKYTIPECNHEYHTNCIMTWFRTGKNACPLCNNQGINNIQQMIANTDWAQRRVAYENYKQLRIFSRKKEAPIELKKMVIRLKKWEKKNKILIKETKEIKESKHPNLTGAQIWKKLITFRRKKWGYERKIRRLKELIGFQQNITNIIIPVKQIV